MKTLNTFLLSISLLISARAEWTEEDRKLEAEQVMIWENEILSAKQNSPSTRLPELWRGLRNMGYRRSFGGHDTAVDVIYEKLQAELLSIPGHALYLGTRIREAYEPLKGPDFKSAIYLAQREMMYGFATLQYLPSPETVKVLGDMLSETWQLPPLPGEEYTPPALARPAVKTLGDLAICNAPWAPIQTTDDLPGAVPAWQAWYDDVRAGRKSFSFRGQAVEYRFKQDGTWDTIPITNSPSDTSGSSHSKMANRQVKPRPARDENGSKGMVHEQWPWIAGAGLGMLGLLAWMLRQKAKA